MDILKYKIELMEIQRKYPKIYIDNNIPDNELQDYVHMIKTCILENDILFMTKYFIDQYLESIGGVSTETIRDLIDNFTKGSAYNE